MSDRPRPRCQICALPGALHFSLIIGATKPDGRHTTRGAGSIDLCETCWRQAKRASHRHPRAAA